MRVCGVAARDAPAAPSSFAQLSTISFSKGKAASFGVKARVICETSVSAKYSTAPSRLSQHLFFDRQHHPRSQKRRSVVVRADCDERAALVEERDVRAVLPAADRSDRRAVPHPARLFGR
jgi:hypothetical protein